MPTELATLCFHTRDAVRRDEGAFTFELPGNSLRNHAVKVALASCEFPIVQQTVERAWNRFYYMEGLRLEPSNNTLLVAYLGCITKGVGIVNDVVDKYNLAYDKHSRRRGIF